MGAGVSAGAGGGEVRGRVRVRVPAHSRAQIPPCEPPAHTAGLGILA